MNETLILIDTITKLILNIAIICAIVTVIYYRKRILEILEEMQRRNLQDSQDEEGVAFMERRNGEVNREIS